MNGAIERPAPPVAPPPGPPPVWPVYAVTLAALPLTYVASALVFVLAAFALVLGDGASGVGLEREVDRVLREEFSKGLPALVLGVAGNGLVFLILPYYVALRGTDRAGARVRLGLLPTDPVDVALTVVGLLGLTTFLDSAVALGQIGQDGRLAELSRLIKSSPADIRPSLALILGVGAGVPEELFFRGFVLHRLVAAQGKIPALVASALMFGAFHFDTVHAPLALIMGLFLGFATLRARSIYPAMIAHVVNNAFFTFFIDVEITAQSELLGLGALGLAATVGTLLVLAKRPRSEQAAFVW